MNIQTYAYTYTYIVLRLPIACHCEVMRTSRLCSVGVRAPHTQCCQSPEKRGNFIVYTCTQIHSQAIKRPIRSFMPRHVPMFVWNGCCVGASCAWPQLEGVVTSGRFQIPGRTNLPLQRPGRHCAACPPLRVWVCPSVWLCVCSKRSVSWRCTGQPFAVFVKQWNYCIVLRFFCLRWLQESVRHKINPETGRTRLRYASECWVRVRVCTWSGEECRENFWRSDYITAEHSSKGVCFCLSDCFLLVRSSCIAAATKSIPATTSAKRENIFSSNSVKHRTPKTSLSSTA